MLSGEQPDGADLDTRLVELDDELAQPDMPATVHSRLRAGEDEERVCVVGAAGPDLPAGQFPAAVDAYRAGADGGEVRAGVRLAEPDGPEAFAAGDCGEVPRLLRLGAIAQQ